MDLDAICGGGSAGSKDEASRQGEDCPTGRSDCGVHIGHPIVINGDIVV